MFALASMQVRVTPAIDWVDYLISAVYFAVTLGIGFVLRKRMISSEDFFLSGRSFLPSLGMFCATIPTTMPGQVFVVHQLLPISERRRLCFR